MTSAAANHARLWSLIGSADHDSLAPQRCLTSTLAKIVTTPTEELDQFFRDVWRREDQDEPHSAAHSQA